MMSNTTGNLSKKAGLPPGTLLHIGRRKSEHTKISIVDYDKNNFNETVCKTINETFPYKEKKTTSWINIDGLHDTSIINSIGDYFGLHHLLQEDILNTKHRPKTEEFDNCIYLTLKMFGIGKDKKRIVSEQVSFVLGNTWIISFQEQEGDIFDDIRLRLRENKGTIRQQGVDYLFYRLIDTIVDNYFFVTENISELTEILEEEVIQMPNKKSLHQLQLIKNQLRDFRKSIPPLREAVSTLQKDNNSLIKDGTLRYLRDVYEHIIQVNESIEIQREILAGIMDLYLTGISNSMNQVMKVLTVIATVFIPLTFIAGIYGMNFDNMPELHWEYGYFGVLGLMLLVIIIMLFFFKRKYWL